jgi:hypothetical protein
MSVECFVRGSRAIGRASPQVMALAGSFAAVLGFRPSCGRVKLAIRVLADLARASRERRRWSTGCARAGLAASAGLLSGKVSCPIMGIMPVSHLS